MAELISSARAGELEPFQELFKQSDATKVFEQTRDEYNKSTCLHMAAANGHTELVQYILENLDTKDKKRIVNLANDHGNTALHWACLSGELSVVKLLVEAEADPMLQNEGGKDSIYQAEEVGTEEIVDYLLSKVDVEPEELDEAAEDAAADKAAEQAAEEAPVEDARSN